MQYVSVAEARGRPVLRLALSVDVPGPWGEGIKQILRYKRLDYLAIAQVPSEANSDLEAWTGKRNAPVMITGDGQVLDRWLDMIMFVERLCRDPAVLPAASADRVMTIGLMHEIAGEDGLGWNRRLMTMRSLGLLADGNGPPSPHWQRIFRDYGVTHAAAKRAPARLVAILTMLSDRLRAQRAAGSMFFVGLAPTATDFYWAAFSQMLRPLPPAVNPMPENVRQAYANTDPAVVAAIDPVLIEHRDHMFDTYIGLPLDF